MAGTLANGTCPICCVKFMTVGKSSRNGYLVGSLFTLCSVCRRPDAQGNTEWSQNYVNDIAWDIIRSLVKGVETLHTGWGCADIAAGYGKFIQSVVHRDIKLKNIGVKKDSDGAVSLILQSCKLYLHPFSFMQ